MAIVRRIDARFPDSMFSPEGAVKKKKVAAYARVSTEQDEQQSSYETQVNFYTNHIQSNPEWEFVGIYSDEGITGTNTKKRDGFNKMIADALDGKIDLILTKSISRFARNTVDSLVTIRKLKEKGVEVYFEKENIYSLDSKGELMLTIMSSIAQEESRSISENVTWGRRKGMADGKVYIARKGFLGYRTDADGNIVIYEKEAAVIREIYSLFLNGKTIQEICSILDSKNIPTPRNGHKWSVSTVKSILTNEKYKGDALLQKSYAVDFLTKKRKKNNGELPQYYVEGSHPAIVSPEIFDLVQNEFVTRDCNIKRKTSIFSSMIICGDCGGFYGRKVKNSKSECKAHYWYCNRKYSGEHACTTPSISEEDIKDAFIRGFNTIIQDKPKYYSSMMRRIDELTDTAELESEIEIKNAQRDEYTTQLRELVNRNAMRSQSQDEYVAEFERLNTIRLSLEAEIEDLQKRIQNMQSQRKQIDLFFKRLSKENKIVESFDDELWSSLVRSMTISRNGNILLMFKDGTTIET